MSSGIAALPSLRPSLPPLLPHRKTALEQALSEKQDFLSRLADVLAWLNQAEKHLAAQKPLGTDYYTVHTQYQAQQVGYIAKLTTIKLILKSFYYFDYYRDSGLR